MLELNLLQDEDATTPAGDESEAAGDADTESAEESEEQV